MLRIFTPDSPYKKQARFVAILWTLFILIGCFAPAKSIPDVKLPLIDKWVHLVLFGGFTFLWLTARPIRSAIWLVTLFFIAVALGATIEILQGILTFLHRSMEFMDAVADSIGGLLGIFVFSIFAYFAEKRK